ncbi:ABC-2 type transporter-domain-containing protein [Lasiosphaeria ovina]|uniref:ABC-2 type transporter-domain-containing protein n=1 Tax=Lasiosphaeria ovina TaxID=92902 RepID=A0AAE0KA54_9PEZI|nr:ABC-2 type transporter-domain-containing protein [Lasiosphaeria ovina]
MSAPSESMPQGTLQVHSQGTESPIPGSVIEDAEWHWHLKPKIEEMRDRDDRAGVPPRELGITWKDLTVQAVNSDAAIHENFTSQFNISKLVKESRHKPPLKTILDASHGCVKPGEMLLVLGRPGAGCTTLLNILSNRRHGFASVTGDVRYGSMDAKEAENYQSQIVMNAEEELFFPTLTETLGFLLELMGIEHTRHTKVGNEFVRGVLGGERKRVSIIECLATRASVFCWDNSTRGLDASTALEYIKAVRALTDVMGMASIVTLYQAGNGIYDLFDKVVVLDSGKQVFYGPVNEAKPFTESIGFVCRDGANVSDYLAGLTVPTERLIRPGHENTFPRNADMLKAEYEKSPIFAAMTAEYDYPTSDEAKERTRLFQEGAAGEKNRHLASGSTLTVSFHAQVMACIVRQYQILWGDKPTLIVKQGSTVVQALIAGSLFYNPPEGSIGLFSKSGALFFSLLHNSLLSMSEVTDSFSGRPVLIKHRSFGLYHPAAFCIGQVAADIPAILLQVSLFALILYFMVGFTMSASVFFTYWILLVAVTMCMTALFRCVGAAFSTFDGASKVSGFLVSALIVYNGYMIQKPLMHPWFEWIFWIDPLAYGFDALLSNEFHQKTIPCVGPNLIPNGPGYGDSAHQSCGGVGGAIQGNTVLSGEDYLASLSYSHSHLWRNFGIIWAFWTLFVALAIVATSRWKSSSESGPSLLIPREKVSVVKSALQVDEESQVEHSREKRVGNSSSDSEGTMVGKDATNINGKNSSNGKDKPDLIRNTSVFTWKNLSYTVKTPHGDRLLLDNVQGWVKPGMLGALMGSSGAGKTTLLDVLAQRKTEGTITGSIMVDGRPLPISFQRSAGYCEQLDIHEPYTTVREALEFSALLRQGRDVPRSDKLKYVNTIIDLLELHDITDTLIGRVGNGLTVEQRKRVTIGVELVSKPSILIFLDEPTSGLDGSSAFNTVRFLRKLADVGQAVLVTIHQPSAQLFSQFDTLLLLAKGGKTVYFGDIGENAQTVKNYFARHGMPCPDEANPAERMIDIVSGSLSQSTDWNRVWLASPEHAAVKTELDRIIADAAAKPPATVDDGHEFAMPLWQQIRIVANRANVSMFRNVDYVNNKLALHIGSSLFNGFSFWMIGDSVSELQLKLFFIFQFIFVAPGALAQLQPLFIEKRDIFEARERKSKMYSWIAFVTGLIVSEFPAGAVFFVMLCYEFIYTGIGQFISAYAPNATFAALTNPLLIGLLVSFCGVLVPYQAIQTFWRYWIYWLNPFNYLMGSMLTFSIWGANVNCSEGEFAVLDPPNGTTCGEYLGGYLQGMGAASNLVNADATAACRVCQYTDGSDYLRSLNLNGYIYGWRDAGICVIFAISSYVMVYALMKLRTKTSKKAE